MRAGFGVGEGVVVAGEFVATGRGDGLQLVVGQAPAEMPPGCSQGVIKNIVRIVHLIHPEHLFQTTLVEGAVVGDQRQPLDQRSDFLPDAGEYRSIFRVLLRQAVDLLAEPLEVLRLRVDEAVERVRDFPVADNHHAHAAHAATALVGRLEVYCGKISHKP